MKIKIINISLIAFVCVISFFALTQVVFSQAQSTFEVTLGVNGLPDPIAPTQPTNLTANVISMSQINLDWDASTDNVAVAGYVIYRDLVAIATTTNIFYIDSSLSASTTYTYYIEAFDAALNYSVPSLSVSATTFPIIIPPVATSTNPTGNTQGSYTYLTIDNLVVTPGMTSAFISFSSRMPTLAKIYWGTTPDFEQGSISGAEYHPAHTFKLDDLEINTLYYFKIEVIDGIGRSTFLLSSFVTQSLPREIEVANPQNFSANYIDDSIRLSWSNPEVFDSVVIVRSDKFFPVDTFDGKTIYKGDNESFLDQEVTAGRTYYYTIFAKDNSGRLSSGSITSATVPNFPGQIVVSNPFDYLPPANSNDPKILKLKFTDFDFYQDGIKLEVQNGDVYIDGEKDLSVAIDYIKLPEVLKTIAVTIYDDKRASFSFLLKINKDKTRYKAVISALNKEGKFPLSAVIVDYKNRSMTKVSGHLISSLLQSIEIKNPVVIWVWTIIILFTILFILLWILMKIMKKIEN